ncbi:hypothetical protein TIFTF001_052711 [Ficus carica]|uniref:Expansin-like CBD domain-containing protein n=1 Tax=Ficus carica TaxID=3494 RepID=A0AA88EBH1_FICCA|nr:hypothetical protein TIFTF001_052711 [Ficus carica]
MYKVHEQSKYPNYLALVVTHVAGQNDITRVELSRGDCKEWVPMRRAYGAVWDTANLPEGSITLRFEATSSVGNSYWVQSTNALPDNWEAGAAYDSKIQLTD